MLGTGMSAVTVGVLLAVLVIALALIDLIDEQRRHIGSGEEPEAEMAGH
jgi:hypothetical protein